MMKKKFIYAIFGLMVTIGVTTVTSCRKGENDPFLSLRSRKARITGEWKQVKGSYTYNSSAAGVPFSTSTTYTESTATSDGITYPFTTTFKVEKDGTYTVEIVDDGVHSVQRGVWFFANANKDLNIKKKEAIVINPSEETEDGLSETFEGFHSGAVLLIDRLTNKELVLKAEWSTSYSLSNHTGNSASERTFEKQ